METRFNMAEVNPKGYTSVVRMDKVVSNFSIDKSLQEFKVRVQKGAKLETSSLRREGFEERNVCF